MSQNNSNDKAAMLAKIEGINKVDGFDPTPFAVDYTDLETGEVRKRLPVMIQMAWFRMKYPEGRIAITVSPGKDCFVATAKVYPSYKDGAECYLAEATASRGYLADEFSHPEEIYLKKISERIEKYPVSKRILACEGFNTYLDSLEKFSKT